jgi:hypothetical protein
MAEDHAGLLRVLAGLVLHSPSNDFRTTLISAVRYVRAVLRDPRTGFFAGSQDADEEYYELPLERRREREAPFVDRTSYTNWTCALAGSLCLAARALDDDALLAEAVRALDNVAVLLSAGDGLLYHALPPGGEPQVRGLLADHVAYVRALLDAHEVSGEARFLHRARATADAVIARFQAPDGGYHDRLASDDAFGRLALADRPIVDNGLFADSLLRLAELTGEARYRERAEATLRIYAHGVQGAGPFAATYARALRRYLSPPLSVRIVGAAAATDEFRETALRLPTPNVTIRTLAPAEAPQLGMPADEGVAYVCVAGACGAPVRDPAALRAAYDALTSARS